jgi:hypothetical protein
MTRARFAAVFLTVALRSAFAQGTYEIEVYGTEITPVRSLLLELHGNYTFRGSEVSVAGNYVPLIDDRWLRAGSAARGVSMAAGCTTAPLFQRVGASSPAFQLGAAASSACATTTIADNYAAHETLEAVTGLSRWSEIGAYLFSSEQASPVVRVMGGSLRAKARVPVSWNWPMSVALSTEIEYDDPAFSNDPRSLEIRPVIERALGRWYLSVNPTLERTLKGTGVVNGLEFSPSAKASFDFSGLITGGVEYYGAFGKIGAFAPPESRLQQFFGVLDLHVSPGSG